MTWLKLYLDLGPNHPIWAAAADAIIAHHTTVAEENVDFMQRTNIFLQTWKTSTTRLPDDLKVLLKAAQKYNVHLDGLETGTIKRHSMKDANMVPHKV